MKYRVKMQRIELIFLCTILFLLLTGCWGDPGTSVKVDNQTDQTIGIFIDGLHEVDVSSGELEEFVTINIYPKDIYPADKKLLIDAKTEQGEVVYSKEFTWQELDDMDWKIVIPPLKE